MHATCVSVISEWLKPMELGPLSWELKREAKRPEFTNGRASCVEVARQLALNEQVFIGRVESTISRNECIVGGANSDVVAIAWCENNLYKLTLMKGWRADVANFVHSCMGGNPVGIWHRRLKKVNVRNVYAFQSIVRGMILGKTFRPTSILVCEICIEDKAMYSKVEQWCGEFSNKIIGNCAFKSLWPHEVHVRERDKVFC